jgi:hypothetical protein
LSQILQIQTVHHSERLKHRRGREGRNSTTIQVLEHDCNFCNFGAIITATSIVKERNQFRVPALINHENRLLHFILFSKNVKNSALSNRPPDVSQSVAVMSQSSLTGDLRALHQN